MRELLNRRRVVTLENLFDALGTRSRMTVFRRLKEAGYRSSFTHAGRYYTLGDTPRFDAQGLWFHEEVGFSRFGTLKETVAHLVPQAPEGQTHSELGALLRVRVHNTLLDLVHGGAIGRRVVERAGGFVYVSPDPAQADQQTERRRQSLQAEEARALPPPETVLAILVETLKAGRVSVGPEVVALRLNARGIRVEAVQVERVFEHYGLLGKKNGSLRPTPSSS